MGDGVLEKNKDGDDQLTPSARLLIRDYLWSRFALPGGAIALAASIMGFLVGDYAAQRSEKAVLDQIKTAFTSSITSQALAENASSQAMKSAAEIDRLRKEIEQSGAVTQALESREALVKGLSERPEIVNAAVQAASRQLRSVFGTVGPDGRIIAGKGFRVTNQGAAYVVIFTRPFREAPVVVASLAGCAQPQAGCSDNFIHVSSADRNTARFLTTDSPGGEEEPNSFSFIAIAPPEGQ